jgi:hypothetical protein
VCRRSAGTSHDVLKQVSEDLKREAAVKRRNLLDGNGRSARGCARRLVASKRAANEKHSRAA